MTFETFPYANYQDLNIDWILKKLKEALDRIENLENVDIHQEIVNIINQMIEDGELEEILDAMLEDLRAAIAALEALTAQHTTEINGLTSDQLRQDEDIEALKTRMTAAEEAILALRAAIQILDPTGEIGDIAQTIAEMQEALLALQRTVSQHTTQITDLIARVTALEQGGSLPYESQYSATDLTGTMTVYEFLTHVHDVDGAVKIGNYIQAAYTDPETLESASAVLVCADRRTVIVKDTKHYAYGMPDYMSSGYAHSSIKTYVDLVVQAIADSAQYTLTPQTCALASHSWLSTTQTGTVEQPPYLSTESHYGLLLSSMAVFGSPCFGALDFNGFDHKLALFDFETPADGIMLSDVVTNGIYSVPESFSISWIGYPTNCFVGSLRVTPHVFTRREAYDTAYPVQFAFVV